jgi:hypothetical protein
MDKGEHLIDPMRNTTMNKSRTFEKMKEIGALKEYLLYIPIARDIGLILATLPKMEDFYVFTCQFVALLGITHCVAGCRLFSRFYVRGIR